MKYATLPQSYVVVRRLSNGFVCECLGHVSICGGGVYAFIHQWVKAHLLQNSKNIHAQILDILLTITHSSVAMWQYGTLYLETLLPISTFVICVHN